VIMRVLHKLFAEVLSSLSSAEAAMAATNLKKWPQGGKNCDTMTANTRHGLTRGFPIMTLRTCVRAGLH
jgi:hypothetical protein